MKIKRMETLETTFAETEANKQKRPLKVTLKRFKRFVFSLGFLIAKKTTIGNKFVGALNNIYVDIAAINKNNRDFHPFNKLKNH